LVYWKKEVRVMKLEDLNREYDKLQLKYGSVAVIIPIFVSSL